MPKPEEVQKLIDALEDAGYAPRAYSGRGMFGKRCVSISEVRVSAWDVAVALFTGNDLDPTDIPEPRQDSLGLGIVLYWPSYEWPKEEQS